MKWQTLRYIAGVALIVIGFLALITPLTPGSWLVFVGAEMIGLEMLSRARMRKYYQSLKEWWERNTGP